MATKEQTKQDDQFVSAYEYSQKQRLEQAQRDIPIEESGIANLSSQEDVFRLRTQNEEWVQNLLKKLSAKTVVKNKQGKFVLRVVPGVSAMMSYSGAVEIINDLSMLMSSSVVLSKTQDIDARQIENEIMESIADRFTLEKDYFGLDNTKRRVITALIRAIVIHQLNRAVQGHESKNMITQVQEQHGEHEVRESTSSTGKGWSWTRSDRR